MGNSLWSLVYQKISDAIESNSESACFPGIAGGQVNNGKDKDASLSRRVSGLSVRYSNPPALAGGCLVRMRCRSRSLHKRFPTSRLATG
jgi:hypothetical protein